jgi:hypothetical protein
MSPGSPSSRRRLGDFPAITASRCNQARAQLLDSPTIHTVTLGLLSADGQSLTFIVDSTSKVFELDEENNSFEVSVLDVMTHDINVESITVAAPIDFIETTSFSWIIANDLSRWGRIDRSRCGRDLIAGGGGDDDWCNEVPSRRG